ncbi:DHS-like NAD/FAD-binding domain-containing protein [Cystobasidium minutum MCA 4210]|uniref:DHS-like NAD/FAD-binding domain-containing protein n=1 Tax=Cystobasidium minutum MCA 4210 TaxID=1397322 RepID=UPI0034CD1784|eukprot:jgi/Rhomi1/46546/CE46545_316
MPAMRISIPRIDYVPKLPPSLAVSADEAADRLATFLDKGKGKAKEGAEGAGTVLLCGAGVSVDSGIRAYRGKGGSYNVNKSYRPIFFHEFVADHYFRQRYWARSYLGYPPVQKAKANKTHFAIAALEYMGYLKPGIITQNVDRLQHKAISHKKAERIIQELHGSLKHVHCLKCGTSLDRDDVQEELSRLNPEWWDYLNDNIRNGTEPKTNPDGDVDLQGRSYETFTPPPCPNPRCTDGILKPSVIFFGENIPPADKKRAESTVREADQMLLVGTSLATYSAYRLLKQAHEAKKDVAMVNVGTSRGDDLVPNDMRFSLGSSDVLTRVALLLSNGKEKQDPVLDNLLRSGIMEPVIDKQRPGNADGAAGEHVVNPQ